MDNVTWSEFDAFSNTKNATGYRIISTIIYALIFVMGLVGNTLLILVVYKCKALHTPTYAYLVSLAAADLLIIVTAVPEAIIFLNFGQRWLLGEAGCAVFIFSNFFGINAGSLSLTAFTVERYLVVCQPLLAQKICNFHRTLRILVACWISTFFYCSPWLGLTAVRKREAYPHSDQCELRLSKELYLVIFSSDLLLFYILPLLIAIIACSKISQVLRNPSVHPTCSFKHGRQHSELLRLSPRVSFVHDRASENCGMFLTVDYGTRSRSDSFLRRHNSAKTSKTQGLRMLVVTVVLFAVAWLPFRGLLIYNMVATEQWLDQWYLLFAKTLIYLSAAMNPFLYNTINHRFHNAVKTVLMGSNSTPITSRRSSRLSNI